MIEVLHHIHINSIVVYLVWRCKNRCHRKFLLIRFSSNQEKILKRVLNFPGKSNSKQQIFPQMYEMVSVLGKDILKVLGRI